MLEVIELFPFCSIANQQSMLVLDILKKAIDEDEIQILKSFIEKNLTD